MTDREELDAIIATLNAIGVPTCAAKDPNVNPEGYLQAHDPPGTAGGYTTVGRIQWLNQSRHEFIRLLTAKDEIIRMALAGKNDGPSIDYRGLLVKYIAQVGACRGVHFINDRQPWMSDDDIETLSTLALESFGYRIYVEPTKPT